MRSPLACTNDPEFKRYCETRNYSSFTIKHYDNTIHVFELFYLYFFMKKDYLQSLHIIKPKYDKPLKEVYTDTELRLLLKKPNIKQCGFAEYRNWVMVSYFIATGQRKNTVLNLKIGDLDFENGLVHLE